MKNRFVSNIHRAIVPAVKFSRVSLFQRHFNINSPNKILNKEFHSSPVRKKWSNHLNSLLSEAIKGAEEGIKKGISHLTEQSIITTGLLIKTAFVAGVGAIWGALMYRDYIRSSVAYPSFHRDAKLSELKKIINNEHIQTIVIDGFPGAGKTTLAEQLCNEVCNEDHKYVIERFDEKEIEGWYRKIEISRGVSIEEAKSRAIKKLSSMGKIILFFDNVDEENFSEIKDLIPQLSKNVRVLLTARDKNVIIKDLHKFIVVSGEFDKNEAKAYIKNHVSDEKEIDLLIDTVGLSPFKIKMSLHYLNVGSFKVREYVKKYNKLRDQSIYLDLDQSTHPELEIILDHLLKKEKTAEWELLQYCVYLDPDFIPLDILEKTSLIIRTKQRYVKELINQERNLHQASLDHELSIIPPYTTIDSDVSLDNHINLESLLHTLKSLSLVETVSKGNTKGVKLHRIIQDGVREYTRAHPNVCIKTDAVIEELLLIAAKEFPNFNVKKEKDDLKKAKLWFGSVETLLQISKEKNVKNKNVAQLSTGVCLYYSECGKLEQSLKYSLQALELRQNLLPNQLHNLIEVLKKFKNYIEKSNFSDDSYYEGVEKNIKAIEDLSVLDITQDNLAEKLKIFSETIDEVWENYKNLGKYKLALVYSLQVLAIRQKFLPSELKDISASYLNIGISYYYLENYDKASQYIKKSKEIFPVAPENDKDMANILNSMGALFSEFAKREIDTVKKKIYSNDALDFCLQSLLIRQRILLPDDQAITVSMNNVGKCYSNLEDHGNAVKYYEDALKLKRKKLFPNDISIATTLGNLGVCYSKLGKHKDALDSQLEALDIRKINLPPDHPHIAESFYHVGCAYLSLYDTIKAQEYLINSFNLNKKLGNIKAYEECQKKLNEMDSYVYWIKKKVREIENFGYLHQKPKVEDKMSTDSVLYRDKHLTHYEKALIYKKSSTFGLPQYQISTDIDIQHEGVIQFYGPVALFLEHSHSLHLFNVLSLITMIENDQITQDTVICIERKQYGNNLGMQDVIILAYILKYNDSLLEGNRIFLPKYIQELPIYSDALLYNAARSKGIKVIGIEGKGLACSKESPCYHRAREEYMVSQLITIS